MKNEQLRTLPVESTAMPQRNFKEIMHPRQIKRRFLLQNAIKALSKRGMYIAFLQPKLQSARHKLIYGGRGVSQRNGKKHDWHLVIGARGCIGKVISSQLTTLGYRVKGVDAVNHEEKSDDGIITARLPEDGFGWMDALIDQAGLPVGVVCAQGVYGRWSIQSYDQERFNEVLASNFSATFWLLHKLVPAMASHHGGRIVVIGSQAGATGGADPLYAASKAACVALIKSIAREYGEFGITANVISPGPVDTEMAKRAMTSERIEHYKHIIPIRRMMYASEIAEVCTFLLTSTQCAINGATIDVDGGLVRR